MQRRLLGRTGHQSSVVVLGGVAFAATDVQTTARAFAQADAAGVNHLDIAPSYGNAEQVVGEVLPDYRARWFVGGKTAVRDAAGARRELEASLLRLRTDSFDLYQLHGVTDDAELSAVLSPGGAAQTLRAAREEGLTRSIGITGHFQRAPKVFLRALEELDLDTVMLPVNPEMLALSDYRQAFDELLEVAAARDVGVMGIKAVARSRWPDSQPAGPTWYRPHRDPAEITRRIRFALSLPITAVTSPGDVSLLEPVLEAARELAPMSAEEQRAEISRADPRDALVAG